MDLSTIPEMHNDFSVTVKDLKCLIESFTAKDDLSQEEYLTQFNPIFLGLVRLGTKMDGFSALYSVDHPNSKISKQYSKAHKELWKILGKLRLGTSKIEKKYLYDKLRCFSWEHIYKTTKMRNDILAHLKDVLKDLLKIQKKI